MLSGTKIAPRRAQAYMTSKARKQPRDSITTGRPRPTPNESRSRPARTDPIVEFGVAQPVPLAQVVQGELIRAHPGVIRDPGTAEGRHEI